MKILYPGNLPRYYLDRNAVLGDIYYSASNAPHADTQRALYTVPAGKKAIVTGYTAVIERTGVAAPVGVAYLSIIYQFGLGDAKVMAYLPLSTNGIGDHKESAAAFTSILVEGKTIQIRTADNSTGGTVWYQSYVSIIEYDA